MGAGFDVVDRIALVARQPGLAWAAELGDVAVVVFAGVGHGSVRLFLSSQVRLRPTDL